MDHTEHLPVAMMDAPKIEQAITNLISNAVEHSDTGARVDIAVFCDDRKFTFSVRDSGPGIAPEKIDLLFKPFARAGGKKTGGEKSTGLGLLITRKIIHAHGGRIWAESRNGEGTTFFFTLPVDTKHL